MTILGLTPETKCDFTGKVPLLELYNLAKKCFLGKLNRTQLEARLSDKRISRQPHQVIANHLFSSDLMPPNIPVPSHSCEKKKQRRQEKHVQREGN